MKPQGIANTLSMEGKYSRKEKILFFDRFLFRLGNSKALINGKVFYYPLYKSLHFNLQTESLDWIELESMFVNSKRFITIRTCGGHTFG